jgi:hypothetical protein
MHANSFINRQNLETTQMSFCGRMLRLRYPTNSTKHHPIIERKEPSKIQPEWLLGYWAELKAISQGPMLSYLIYTVLSEWWTYMWREEIAGRQVEGQAAGDCGAWGESLCYHRATVVEPQMHTWIKWQDVQIHTCKHPHVQNSESRLYQRWKPNKVCPWSYQWMHPGVDSAVGHTWQG